MKRRTIFLESLEERHLLSVTAGALIAYSELTDVAQLNDFEPVVLDNIDSNPAPLGSCPCDEEKIQLSAPEILTGSNGYYASYGLNRHLIQWGAVENSSGYKLEYTTDGTNWTAITTMDTSVVVSHLAYGAEVTYRVKVRGTGSYTCSDWSETRTFTVCPMDINGDGDISGADRAFLANAWLSEEGEEEYRYYCDINGDGDISNADRVFLANNWLADVAEDTLDYPATDELPDITDVSLTGHNGYYDGNAYSITVNDPHTDTDTILYSLDGITYDLQENPAFTEIGSYTIYVKVSRANYNEWVGSATVVINQIPEGDITYTVCQNGRPHTGDGSVADGRGAETTTKIYLDFVTDPGTLGNTLGENIVVTGATKGTVTRDTEYPKVIDGVTTRVTRFTVPVSGFAIDNEGKGTINVQVTGSDYITNETKPVDVYMVTFYWGCYCGSTRPTFTEALGYAHGYALTVAPTQETINNKPTKYIDIQFAVEDGYTCGRPYIITLDSWGTVAAFQNIGADYEDELDGIKPFDPIPEEYAAYSGRRKGNCNEVDGMTFRVVIE